VRARAPRLDPAISLERRQDTRSLGHAQHRRAPVRQSAQEARRKASAGTCKQVLPGLWRSSTARRSRGPAETVSRSRRQRVLSNVVITFSTTSRARRARRAPAGPWSRARQRVRRGEAAGVVRRGGRKHPRDSRRSRTGSSALAPAAHGGLPPGRDPGHRPSPVGRRYARRARLRGNGHPPGAPALSRPRSPSRALRPAASASHAMALRAPLDCDLGAAHDRACRKDGHERACSDVVVVAGWKVRSAATPCPLHLPPKPRTRAITSLVRGL
jgi:hypothetical protein